MFYLHACMYICVCTMCMQCLRQSEEGITSGTGLRAAMRVLGTDPRACGKAVSTLDH